MVGVEAYDLFNLIRAGSSRWPTWMASTQLARTPDAVTAPLPCYAG